MPLCLVSFLKEQEMNTSLLHKTVLLHMFTSSFLFSIECTLLQSRAIRARYESSWTQPTMNYSNKTITRPDYSGKQVSVPLYHI